MYPRVIRNPAALAAVCAACFGVARLCLALGTFAGVDAPIWPASGFALAAATVLGRRIWPAIFFGIGAAQLAASGHVAPSVTIAVGATLEAVIGAALVERLAHGAAVFTTATTVFRFVAIAAFAAAPLGATFGALATSMSDAMPWPAVAPVWSSWWLADLTSMVVVAPFITLWATTALTRRRWLVIVESAALLALLTAVSTVIFDGKFPSDVKNYPLEFLCVPFLLWSAFRLGRRTVATAIVVLAGATVWGTLHGFGPFVRDSPSEAFVLFHAYVSVMAIMGVVLAAVVVEYHHAQDRLGELATTDPLTGLVNYRRLLEVLRAEIARSSRTHRSFAVLFVDMNGLKRINDRFGHLTGSRALCRVADTLRRTCRSIDTPARFGGDEFAVVLPETDAPGGQRLLERVNERLAADGDRPALAVSGGVAVFPRDGDSPTLLLRAADAALYAAKAGVLPRESPAGDKVELKIS